MTTMTTTSNFAEDNNIRRAKQVIEDESNHLSVPLVALLHAASSLAIYKGHRMVTTVVLIVKLDVHGPWSGSRRSYFEYLISSGGDCKFQNHDVGKIFKTVALSEDDSPVEGFSPAVIRAIGAAHESRKLSGDMWTSLDHFVPALLASKEAKCFDPIMKELRTSRQEVIDKILRRRECEDGTWILCDRLWERRGTCRALLSSK
jgi:hypothetical protein